MIICGLVYISIEIRHRVQLSMLPRSLWLEPAAHLGRRVFCPSALGWEGERGGDKAVRGKGRTRGAEDTDSDNDERIRAALPGFNLYL